jgi:hypothetical protein
MKQSLSFQIEILQLIFISGEAFFRQVTFGL